MIWWILLHLVFIDELMSTCPDFVTMIRRRFSIVDKATFDDSNADTAFISSFSETIPSNFRRLSNWPIGWVPLVKMSATFRLDSTYSICAVFIFICCRTKWTCWAKCLFLPGYPSDTAMWIAAWLSAFNVVAWFVGIQLSQVAF